VTTPDGGDHQRNDYPWLLRKAPAISVSAGCEVAGILVLVWSDRLRKSQPWLSELLLTLGAAIVLVPVLTILGIVFGRELVRRGRQETRRVDRIEESVESVRRSVDDILAELSQRAVDQLAADRSDDEHAIDSVQRNPTSRGVADALRVGRRLGFTWERGPRVRIFDTDLLARWLPDPEDEDVVEVVIETTKGRERGRFQWTPTMSAADLGEQVGRLLRDINQYPGDIAFHFGQAFADLYELLGLGYRAETGAGGVVRPYGPIIQLFYDDWILTDFCITTRDGYQITLDRLDEMDWDSHIRSKRTVDIAGFRWALETAEALLEAGLLKEPPRPKRGPFDQETEAWTRTKWRLGAQSRPARPS
jgi:hypothetical protein